MSKPHGMEIQEVGKGAVLAQVVTEIQSLGVRVGKGVLQRLGGAGPADAGTFLIDDRVVNVPTASPFVSASAYSLRAEDGNVFLCKDRNVLCPVEVISRPRFYDRTTSDGTPCSKVALLHGSDCLATSVLQTCIYWNSKNRCRFCGIQLSLKSGKTIPVKTAEHISETARIAKALDGVNHMVLTTGTARPLGAEISILAEACSAIKRTVDLPVHAQFMPSTHLERLHELKEHGVDTVGIHIETFDMEVLSKIAPAKAAVGLKTYDSAWKSAVEIFGPNQVSSFLIAGLGENPESILTGSEYLADLGVYPFVVPLRPIPGSRMENALPPDPGAMAPIYEKVARILQTSGLSAGLSLAGCVRCGACSALPFYEKPQVALTFHRARTREELLSAFDIRKEAFVQEQKIFEGSDRDENDHNSIHLIAKYGKDVVGTVRVFPHGGDAGYWVGGRLAVKKGFRASGVGELLVRNAVKTVKREGCTRFTAYIQEDNIRFFSQIGWKPVGPIEASFGRPHRQMQASLGDAVMNLSKRSENRGGIR